MSTTEPPALDPAEVSGYDSEKLRRTIRAYLAELLPDGWISSVEQGDREGLRAARAHLDTAMWWKAMARSGLAAPQWDVGQGGLGLHGPRARIVFEELARVRAPASSNPIGIGLVGPVLMRHGTDGQKELLARIASHEDIWCQLFSEPGAGSDLASLATRAVRDGGHWILDGQKVWSSLAHQARWGLLLARTDPDLEKHAGITAFILDMTLPGVEVRPLRLLTGDSHFNEVFLTGVRITDSMRLGQEGRGWEIARTTLAFEHSDGDPGLSGSGGAPGRDVGSIIERYGPVDDPWLQSRLVDAWIGEQVGRSLSVMLREERRQGVVPGAEGSMEKLYHSEHRQRVQELLIDMGGEDAVAFAPGDTWPERSAWAFLRIRTRTIAGGTSEIHRDKIAERMLGLPRDNPFKDVPWRDVTAVDDHWLPKESYAYVYPRPP